MRKASREVSVAIGCAVMIAASAPAFAQVEFTRPSQILTLLTQNGDSCDVVPDAHPVGAQVLDDGSFGLFSIPAGQVFAITDIGYSVSGGFSANETKKLLLFAEKSPSAVIPLFSTVVMTGSTALGRLGGGYAIPPSTFVRSGFRLCVLASEINGAPAEGIVLVHGHFTKDQ